MKDIRNILLLVVSLCLVGTWVYHLYDKSQYSTASATATVLPDSAAIQRSINDSLLLAYNTVLSQIDSSRNVADTATAAIIPTATNEIDSLRNEIAAILTINNITKEDLRRAEEKIRQLQQRLTSSATTSSNPAVSGSSPSPSTTTRTESTTKPESTNEVFTATGISLRAIQGDKDQITVNAATASSLSIACVLQNRNTSFTDTEVYMVLTDPSGDVVQDDPWQSGMFTTGNDRIPYTRKAKLAYNKGDNSRIAMNLKLQEYPKGLYSVQFYHNGVRIGRSTLRLN